MNNDIFFSKTIHLVIPTKGIGGAEKRFIGLWLFLVKHKILDIRLHLLDTLFQECLKIQEFEALNNHKSKIIFLSLDHNRKVDFKRLISNPAYSNGIFHFVMQRPLGFIKQRSIFSLTESHLDNVNLNGKINIFLSCLFSSTMDILDPQLWRKFRNYFFFKKNTLYQTSGSFVNSDRFKPAVQKKNDVVFLGVYTAIKQIDRFVAAMPAIQKSCQSKNIRFFVLGYGAGEEEVFTKLEAYKKDGMEIEYGFHANPSEILQEAKVIYSLQRNTNYPSKSLLEGLACGCLPVVTDVGDSRLLASPAFSYYVKEFFEPAKIAAQTLQILELSDSEFAKKSTAAITHVKTEFTIDRMAQYYADLYVKA